MSFLFKDAQWGPFRKDVLKLLSGWAVFMLVCSFVIVFLFLKYSFSANDSTLESAMVAGFCLLFLWAGVANLRSIRAIRYLNAEVTWEFIGGPRPEDVDELRLWWWTRQAAYALIAMACYMLTLAIVGLFGDW